MATNEGLRAAIEQQRAVLAQLEAEFKALEASDAVRESAELRGQLNKLRGDYDAAIERERVLAEENANVKTALYEQIYNEKVRLVNTTEQKLDAYFTASGEVQENRLTVLENTVKARINAMRDELNKHNIDARDELYAQLEALSMLTDERLAAARAAATETSVPFSAAERAELDALKSEPVTDEQLRGVAKKNNLERFVGLNILNAAGILLIIVGVIAVARLTYVNLNDTLKGVLMFALGAVMLVAGELMNRRKPNIFALGITAGGIGVLYVALATSYFALHILGVLPAMVVCVLITAAAFLLSVRYNSQAILTFALIGGYLPIFSIFESETAYYAVMLFFVVLNLLALMTSFKRKWRAASFIGLAMNIIGTFFIVLSFWEAYTAGQRAISLLYVVFAFLVYTLIPIIGTLRTQARFRKSDVVLLAINTVFSTAAMYVAFYRFDLDAYFGALAIIYAVIYLALGRFLEVKFAEKQPSVKTLFYLTGLAFVVLVIPLQFDVMWLSLGWLAEGVLLATYGILRNEKLMRRVGVIIGALCLAAFLRFDLWWRFGDGLFMWKYLAITLGTLIILAAYAYKKQSSKGGVLVYKLCALANVWFYTIYIIAKLIGDNFDYNTFNVTYMIFAVSITATFVLAYVLPRIRPIADGAVRVMSVVLHLIGVVWLFVVNATMSPNAAYWWSAVMVTSGVKVLGNIVIVVTGVVSVLAVHDVLKTIITRRRVGVEWFPTILSGYAVLILTQNLIAHYNLAFSSMVITIIYVLTALAWIIFGFVRRYTFIRHFGLGLALLSVVKLFLVDLWGLTEGRRIVSYFALGVTLLAISFVYQRFSRRLELSEAATRGIGETARRTRAARQAAELRAAQEAAEAERIRVEAQREAEETFPETQYVAPLSGAGDDADSDAGDRAVAPLQPAAIIVPPVTPPQSAADRFAKQPKPSAADRFSKPKRGKRGATAAPMASNVPYDGVQPTDEHTARADMESAPMGAAIAPVPPTSPTEDNDETNN